MITLQDAIERARLAADEGGILSQSFYNQLISQVDEVDVHPLTVALVENGLMVRTGSLTVKALNARRKALYWDVDEGVGDYEKEDGISEEEVSQGNSSEDMSEIRDVLETAGISVSSDGMVSFYGSNIPGLYTEKLPQALPLATAVQLWEQKLEIADSEKDRVGGIQDALSRLKSQVVEKVETKGKSPNVSEIEASLGELEGYGFDPRSKSEMSQAISGTIENIFDTIMSSNWRGSAPAIDEAQDVLEEYISNQNADYEQGLYVWDALDKLIALQSSDPGAFESAIGNLGGLAARLCAQEEEGTLVLNWNLGEFTEFAEDLYTQTELEDLEDSSGEFVQALRSDAYDWISGAVSTLLESDDLPSFISDVNLKIDDMPSSGVFESRGSEQEDLDFDETEDLLDIIKGYILRLMKEEMI